MNGLTAFLGLLLVIGLTALSPREVPAQTHVVIVVGKTEGLHDTSGHQTDFKKTYTEAKKIKGAQIHILCSPDEMNWVKDLTDSKDNLSKISTLKDFQDGMEQLKVNNKEKVILNFLGHGYPSSENKMEESGFFLSFEDDNSGRVSWKDIGETLQSLPKNAKKVIVTGACVPGVHSVVPSIPNTCAFSSVPFSGVSTKKAYEGTPYVQHFWNKITQNGLHFGEAGLEGFLKDRSNSGVSSSSDFINSHFGAGPYDLLDFKSSQLVKEMKKGGMDVSSFICQWDNSKEFNVVLSLKKDLENTLRQYEKFFKEFYVEESSESGEGCKNFSLKKSTVTLRRDMALAKTISKILETEIKEEEKENKLATVKNILTKKMPSKMLENYRTLFKKIIDSKDFYTRYYNEKMVNYIEKKQEYSNALKKWEKDKKGDKETISGRFERELEDMCSQLIQDTYNNKSHQLMDNLRKFLVFHESASDEKKEVLESILNCEWEDL